MGHCGQARKVVRVANLWVQPEEATEHGWHQVRRRDPVAGDEVEGLFGVPLVHQHHCLSKMKGAHGVAERRPMVSRTGDEVNVVLVNREVCVSSESQRVPACSLISPNVGKRLQYALRPAGRTGGVKQAVTCWPMKGGSERDEANAPTRSLKPWMAPTLKQRSDGSRVS